MLGRAAIILALAVFAGGCNVKLGSSKEDVATAKMEEFVSQEGKFKAKFPGKPETQRQDVNVPAQGKTIKMKLTMFSTMSDNAGFAVAVTEIPLPGDLDPIDTKNMLEKSRDGAIANVGGTIDSSKSVLLQNRYQGIEVIARTAPPKGPADGQMKARIYLAGKRLYQVLAVGNGKFATEARADEFFESFQVTE